jgi:exopolysaccharide biosynthesis polyprenyl glycosylphosphotransferase
MLIRLKKIILLLGDLLGLHLALFLMLAIRYPQPLWAENWATHWPNFLVIFLIWLLLIYIKDLYNLNLRAASRRFFSLILNTAALASILSVLYFYLIPAPGITPKTNLAIFIAIYLIIFFLWRALYQAAIHSFIRQDNLAIIGFNVKTEKLVAELQNNPGAGYRAALIFKSPEEIASLPDQIRAKDIRTIVVCDDFAQEGAVREALFACLPYNLTFFNYPEFYELLTGKVPVEAIGPDWFLDNLQAREKNYFNLLKQLLDFILALLILIITLPLWPLIALGIKLTSRGPVFFRQTRLGKDEKEFRIIKFRTMRVDNNHQGPTEAGDRRITGLGSFLRQTRLDEIPQVLNILKGEMSFIGPRPERPEIVAELEHAIPFYKTRLLIKPGLTGWDQVSGNYHSASPDDSLEKLQYDLFYLSHRSLYLDITIVLKTIATMMSRTGR